MHGNRLATFPTLVVAAGCLVIGLAAPAAARQAGHLINGDSIKAHSIAGNRLKANTVTGADVKESTLGTVPRAKAATTLPALRWRALTLVHGWANLGAAGYLNAAYAVDAQGVVRLRGSISGGTSGDVAFSLPGSVLSHAANFYLTDTVDESIGAPQAGELEVTDGGFVPLPGIAPGGAAVSSTDLAGVTFSTSP
jgi:hypothetical protein